MPRIPKPHDEDCDLGSLRSHSQEGHGGPAAGNLIQECLFLLYGKSKQMMNRATQRSRNVLFFLFSYVQDKTWNEVMETHQKLPVDQLDLRKQQEAVWELFTSECTYFLDHLLVLKMVMLGLIFVVDGQYKFDFGGICFPFLC